MQMQKTVQWIPGSLFTTEFFVSRDLMAVLFPLLIKRLARLPSLPELATCQRGCPGPSSSRRAVDRRPRLQ